MRRRHQGRKWALSGRKGLLPPEPSREGRCGRGLRDLTFQREALEAGPCREEMPGPRGSGDPLGSEQQTAGGRQAGSSSAVGTGKAGGAPGGEVQAGGQPAGRVRSSLLCPAGFPRPSLPRWAVVWLKLSLRFFGWFGRSFLPPSRRSARQRAPSSLSFSVWRAGKIPDFPTRSAEMVSGPG